MVILDGCSAERKRYARRDAERHSLTTKDVAGAGRLDIEGGIACGWSGFVLEGFRRIHPNGAS